MAMDRYEAVASLKVHRVIPKNEDNLTFLNQDELKRFFSLEDDLCNQNLPSEVETDWRFLPRSYGQIYLGETFSFVVKTCNDSDKYVINDLVVRVDLQLFSQRVINLAESQQEVLNAQESHHLLLHHEIKEMGANILICTVSYRCPSLSSETTSFRKYFKFHVDKPLDVKTKFYNAESDEVYLEALLENLTNLPMSLDSVKLEPSQFFDVRQMNTVVDEENATERWVFGKVNRFNSSEFRQYLFCLTPKVEIRENVSLLKTITVIGKLDIMWTSGVGCKGHLQTSQLERMGPNYSDIRLTITKIPSQVQLKTKFDFTCKITNCCDYEMEPFLFFDNLGKEQSILWLGISGASLGKLAPSQSIEVLLSGYPIKTGLCPIPCLKLSESNLRNSFTFEEPAFVYVNESEDVAQENSTDH